MPLVIGLLIMMAVVFQMFFRYEHWPSRDQDGVVYEHDNLTGETRMLKPGDKVSLVARIFGSGEMGGSAGRYLESIQLHPDRPRDSSSLDLSNPRHIAKAAQPIPVPKEVVVASSSPPVPMAMMAADIEDAREPVQSFAVRQVDLNQDGAIEEIIQNATQSDGLLDISIVRGGREIFFGRGRQISLLPSRSIEGWADIVLKTDADQLKVFRYNPRQDAYQSLNDKKG